MDFRLEIEILLVKSTLLISNMFIVFQLRAKQNFFISKVRILNFGLLVKIDVFLEKIFWVWLPSIIFGAAFRSIQDTFMLQKWTKNFNAFLNNGQFLVFKMLSWKWLCWANRWDFKKSYNMKNYLQTIPNSNNSQRQDFSQKRKVKAPGPYFQKSQIWFLTLCIYFGYLFSVRWRTFCLLWFRAVVSWRVNWKIKGQIVQKWITKLTWNNFVSSLLLSGHSVAFRKNPAQYPKIRYIQRFKYIKSYPALEANFALPGSAWRTK